MEHAPDGWFYYAVTLAFGGALIYVLLRYTGKIDATLSKLQDAVQELKAIVMVHEKRHDDHDEDIADLKKSTFTVNYRK